MKATGVIRRIDDLGRIVIPKEIRNNLKIRNGETLEIFIDNLDQIILKKYSMGEDYRLLLSSYVTTINDAINRNIIITDKNRILSANDEIKKDYENRELSTVLAKCIDTMKSKESLEKTNIKITGRNEIQCSYIIKPIIAASECVGILMIFDENDNLNSTDQLIANIACTFLGKYIEN